MVVFSTDVHYLSRTKVQVFEDPEEQCCKVHETSTTEALDGDFPISRRPLAHDNLASPEVR